MPEASEAWRLFVAIELPAAIRRRIQQHVDRIRRELPDARASWTREENFHLTLKFFGDTPVERVEAVSAALKRAASRIPLFKMQLSGCGVFPTRGKPNVLWIGINDPTNNLQRLHQSFEDELARLGFHRDERAFHPHLTIARIRNPKHVRSLGDLHQRTDFGALSVEAVEVCLIRSELSSAGSRYTVVAMHKMMS